MSNPQQALLDIVGLGVGLALAPTGAGLLWAMEGLSIASAAGAILFPAKPPNGPQISSLQTTTCTIGAPLPIAYGTINVAGNVIYLGPLQTSDSNSSSSCFGGSGGTQYQYNQSIGICLCEGPIDDVLRIWENGLLVYDKRPQQIALGELDTDYANRLAANAKYITTFVLYYGTTTQMPDPTIEADKGVGNVSGNRGYAYIVYPNRLLQASQGLRHPQVWKFEVVKLTAGAGEYAVVPPVWLASPDNLELQADPQCDMAVDWNNLRYYVYSANLGLSGAGEAILGFDLVTNTQIVQRLSSALDNATTGLGSDGLCISSDGNLLFSKAISGSALGLFSLNPTTLATNFWGPGGSALPYFDQAASGVALSAGTSPVRMILYGWGSSITVELRNTAAFSAIAVFVYGLHGETNTLIVAEGSNVNASQAKFYVLSYAPAVSGVGGALYFSEVIYDTGTAPLFNPSANSTYVTGGIAPSDIDPAWTFINSVSNVVWDSTDNTIIAQIAGANTSLSTDFKTYLVKIDPQNGGSVFPYVAPQPKVLWATQIPGNVATLPIANESVIVNYDLVLPSTTSPTMLMRVDTSTGAITTGTLDYTADLGSLGLSGTFAWNAALSIAVGYVGAGPIGDGGTTQPYVFLIGFSSKSSQVSLADIESDLCVRGGFTTDQIDVTDLENIFVDGFGVGSFMDIRTINQPLAQLGMFDTVPSGTQVRFQTRGGPPVATLSDDDLGAYEMGDQPPPKITSTRALEEVLPRQVRLRYISPSRNYDTGEQLSPMRLGVTTVSDLDVQLAVAIEDSQAKQAAEILQADAWTSRQTYQATVDMSWGALEVGDVILVPSDSFDG